MLLGGSNDSLWIAAARTYMSLSGLVPLCCITVAGSCPCFLRCISNPTWPSCFSSLARVPVSPGALPACCRDESLPPFGTLGLCLFGGHSSLCCPLNLVPLHPWPLGTRQEQNPPPISHTPEGTLLPSECLVICVKKADVPLAACLGCHVSGSPCSSDPGFVLSLHQCWAMRVGWKGRLGLPACCASVQYLSVLTLFLFLGVSIEPLSFMTSLWPPLPYLA